MSFSEAFEMLEPMMKSLSKIHSKGLIHRDISPANIMVQAEKQITLIDFGAAREFDAQAEKSLSVILKHGYAPTEQYQTRGLQGPWTDVYAVCATIYKMITGITPPSAIDRMVGDTMKRPSEFGADIDPQKEAALLKGLAINQADRYSSVQDLGNAFHGIVPPIKEKTPPAYEATVMLTPSGGEKRTEMVVPPAEEKVPEPEIMPEPVKPPEPEVQPEPVIMPEPVKKPEPEKEIALESVTPIRTFDNEQEGSRTVIQTENTKKKNGVAILGIIAAVSVVALIIGVVIFNNNRPVQTAYIPADVATENTVTQEEKEDEKAGSSDNIEQNVETSQESDTSVSFDASTAEASEADTVEIAQYDSSSFSYDGQILKYEDEYFTSRFGIDVSHYQNQIDWNMVKNAGVDFAIIRIGYRGYGTEGALNIDNQFEANIKNAQAAGVDVGVYFFSQAINEDEAKEEANYVLSALSGYSLQLPIAIEPITIMEEGRTNGLSGAQLARNANAFCETVTNAGYETMVAFNDEQWDEYRSDIANITFPYWYGNYDTNAQPPFICEFFQYSNHGSVDGISTTVDLDIQFVKK